MTIRSDITIDWTVSPRIVEVPAPSLTVQDLYDTLRDKAALGEAMDDAEIIEGSGKDNLGEGVLVGLTIKLLNAKIKFEAQASPTVCTVLGGNLVAVDENGASMSPLEPSTNVSAVIAQSTSASLIEGSGADPLAIADAVWDELLTGHLTTSSFGALVNFLYGIEGGRWKMQNNQMIFYEADNITEIARFNLYRADGQPSETNVVDRQRV